MYGMPQGAMDGGVERNQSANMAKSLIIQTR